MKRPIGIARRSTASRTDLADIRVHPEQSVDYPTPAGSFPDRAILAVDSDDTCPWLDVLRGGRSFSPGGQPANNDFPCAIPLQIVLTSRSGRVHLAFASRCPDHCRRGYPLPCTRPWPLGRYQTNKFQLKLPMPCSLEILQSPTHRYLSFAVTSHSSTTRPRASKKFSP
jgi:hypothetical protein